jgi:hypothetical protein
MRNSLREYGKSLRGWVIYFSAQKILEGDHSCDSYDDENKGEGDLTGIIV